MSILRPRHGEEWTSLMYPRRTVIGEFSSPTLVLLLPGCRWVLISITLCVFLEYSDEIHWIFRIFNPHNGSSSPLGGVCGREGGTVDDHTHGGGATASALRVFFVSPFSTSYPPCCS